jgi:hypothetical protein
MAFRPHKMLPLYHCGYFLNVIADVCSGYTECSALSDDKMKHVSSTFKCIEEIVMFFNTVRHVVLYVLSRSQYGHH